MLEPEGVPDDIAIRGWLTTAQAGAALGWSGRTVQTYCEEGRIPSTRVENGWRRIAPGDLLDFAKHYTIKLNWDAIILKPNF
jgi:hypothetical protein